MRLIIILQVHIIRFLFLFCRHVKFCASLNHHGHTANCSVCVFHPYCHPVSDSKRFSYPCGDSLQAHAAYNKLSLLELRAGWHSGGNIPGPPVHHSTSDNPPWRVAWHPTLQALNRGVHHVGGRGGGARLLLCTLLSRLNASTPPGLTTSYVDKR